MEILFLLIPISILLLGLAIWAFFWAVKNKQFDDLQGPAYSILFDDEKPLAHKEKERKPEKEQEKKQEQAAPSSNNTKQNP